MADELSARCNVMIKIPASTSGIPVFKYLASKGVATNATTCFNVPQIMAVANAVTEGITAHRKAGKKGTAGELLLHRCQEGLIPLLSGAISKRKTSLLTLLSSDRLQMLLWKNAKLMEERENSLLKCLCVQQESIMTLTEMYFIPILTCLQALNGIYMSSWHDRWCILYHYRNKGVKDGWKAPVPADVMKKLNRVPYFVKGYAEDGYAIEQFDEITSDREYSCILKNYKWNDRFCRKIRIIIFLLR